MKNLRLIDIVKCITNGDIVITREELVDRWNKENPDEPATYEYILPSKEVENKN